MKVTVEDDREFPEYKNVEITALVREAANDKLDWAEAVEVGEVIANAITDADYLCDSRGRTWAVSFDPKEYKMDKSDIKIINKGLHEFGNIPGESWYGWMVVEVPSDWLNRETWQEDIGWALDLWAGNTGPGRAFRNPPSFLVDTYSRYHQDRTTILIKQMGGLDV